MQHTPPMPPTPPMPEGANVQDVAGSQGIIHDLMTRMGQQIQAHLDLVNYLQTDLRIVRQENRDQRREIAQLREDNTRLQEYLRAYHHDTLQTMGSGPQVVDEHNPHQGQVAQARTPEYTPRASMGNSLLAQRQHHATVCNDYACSLNGHRDATP